MLEYLNIRVYISIRVFINNFTDRLSTFPNSINYFVFFADKLSTYGSIYGYLDLVFVVDVRKRVNNVHLRLKRGAHFEWHEDTRVCI